MKTLAELRQYIYDFLDVEEFDISQSLLNTWAKEGYDRIIKVSRRLPFFEQEFTTVTEAGVDSIPFPDGLESIDWMTVDGRLMASLNYREAYEEYVSWSGSRDTGSPLHFSVHNERIFFWPQPQSALDVVIQGWRAPLDWVAISGAPDMPEEFESVLLSYMLYRAYGHQGLIEDQQVERSEFDSQLGQLTAWEKETPTQSPLILGGGRRRNRHMGPAPLTFPVTQG